MRYQVAVVGAGMVGATLAAILGQKGIRVALVEEQPARSEVAWPEFDLRVSAVTKASQRIFEALDAWSGMLARRVSPYREMHVWDAAGTGSIHFDSADLGEPDLGHIIENRVLVAALEERLAALESVDWFRPAAVSAMERTAESIHLGLQNERIEAKLVVGADGARSRIRQLAGLACVGRDYAQQALVATVRTEKGHGETAWQRFLPGGPLAFLPLLNGFSSIVWSAPSRRAQELLGMEAEEFATALARAFEERLGTVQWVGPRATFPLRRQHVLQYVKPQVALVGDAAHTIHPLAGQGVNLGLLDAASLAQVLTEAIAGGRDAGDFRVLRRYERWRKGQNLATEALMDGFKRLFGTSVQPIPLMRGIGMNLTDASGPVKRSIMRLAMGLKGDLPALARGGAAALPESTLSEY